MRIIAGTAGGVPIKVPRDTTRPTTDRVRESVFSSLGDYLVGATVLDLFAGSGSLGIESLSRGAERAVLVEQARSACEIIQANLEKTKLSALADVRATRAERFLVSINKTQRFDLIFADPPYARDEDRAAALESFLNQPNLPKALSNEGLLVLESYSRAPLPAIPALPVMREKIYGDTRITWHKASEVDLVT